jgi:hypothetical protein
MMQGEPKKLLVVNAFKRSGDHVKPTSKCYWENTKSSLKNPAISAKMVQLAS